ncbi:molybdate ABC transporter substrate-binding protein [Paracoccus aerius]|uniref:Molybdate ABC transporter substrate-binding protein n=1 Tax=Paracoccus aerius TaxID=1915382 RepID=A0ABS1S7L1_9RHOB|nr:molybdate ABC transporter substrate-binding protein [Paracoccus aerius]MBL3674698.1 molybdate ABC transporter substrate-binding protein [Paracoccus aerius]GHG28905.1 molybdate ABC transporter substrate-binding protein [Paracoccus aerius]
MPSLHATLVTCLALAVSPLPAIADDVTVFAAASLTDALDRVAREWSAETGQTAVISYAGSPVLAKQIGEGAPADIFISASPDWMDELEASGDIRPDTRRDLLGNSLVLIAHGAARPVTVDKTLDLPAMLDGGKLSMAMVDSVPAGIYGKAALIQLGLWDKVAPMVAQSDNVRTALAFVARNEAPLGIVYATDAAAQENVTVIGTFPAGSHDPIIYPAAITAQSDSDQAEAFLDYLSSAPAQAIWRDFGFTVPE